MKVKFSPETRDDFGKYKDYLQKLKKSNTDKYRHIKPLINYDCNIINNNNSNSVVCGCQEEK